MAEQRRNHDMSGSVGGFKDNSLTTTLNPQHMAVVLIHSSHIRPYRDGQTTPQCNIAVGIYHLNSNPPHSFNITPKHHQTRNVYCVRAEYSIGDRRSSKWSDGAWCSGKLLGPSLTLIRRSHDP